MRRTRRALVASTAWVAACAGPAAPTVDLDRATREVLAAETAFARSMADRDFAAFGEKVSEQAIFDAGATTTLRGKAEVLRHWQRWFAAPKAPFSWSPDRAEVTADGSLAHTTGPVLDPAGQPVARFHSVWRLEAPGLWRVVFDRGERCDEAAERAARAGAERAAVAGSAASR